MPIGICQGDSKRKDGADGCNEGCEDDGGVAGSLVEFICVDLTCRACLLGNLELGAVSRQGGAGVNQHDSSLRVDRSQWDT